MRAKRDEYLASMRAKRDEYLVVKTCGCGRRYRLHEWRGLVRIGFQIGCRDERDVPCELRNCTCGSTLTLEVELDEVIDVATQGVDRVRASAARTAIDLLLVVDLQEPRSRRLPAVR